MIVCDYLMFVLGLGSTSATGERGGPVLRPACLRARETWCGVVCVSAWISVRMLN